MTNFEFVVVWELACILLIAIASFVMWRGDQ